MKNIFLTLSLLLFAGSASAQIHTGGIGDGWSGKSYSQTTDTTLFTGGNGDGYTLFTFRQNTDTTLFTGGNGDGYALNRYTQKTDTILFTGGVGDGYALNRYTQKTDTMLFTGGVGDGYSFTAIPITPLPLSWLAFTGRRNGTSHELQWKVAQTESGEAFQLERSPNGAAYSPIYQVLVESTLAGETLFPYTDESPLDGDNFYRVRYTAISGKVSYSSTVLLRNLGKKRSLVLFPNPAATQIRLRVEGDLSHTPLEGVVYNAAGQQLSRFRLEGGSPHYDLDISGWAAGSYFLKVLDGAKATVIPFLKTGQ